MAANCAGEWLRLGQVGRMRGWPNQAARLTLGFDSPEWMDLGRITSSTPGGQLPSAARRFNLLP
jgi:hypothetical protein